MTDSEEQIRNEEASDFVERRYSTTLMGIVHTVEWVLIALILAFVFRAFMMEQFRIPTGSMAETLRGVHYHLRCGRCGYKYDTDVDAASSRCPSCKYLFDPETIVSISNGDRIFVDKCLYNFTEPKRWDVVVFKNPLNPKENYIKRMIALPGEEVEIVDGDIYIDGQIARKPAKVQQEFWMPILVNDFQPAGRTMKNDGGSDDGLKNSTWTQPFSNQGASKWDVANSGAVFRLNTKTDEMNTIVYDSGSAENFRAGYSYNSSVGFKIRPVCSDLMVRFFVNSENNHAAVGADLLKYGREYKGTIHLSGLMTIESVIDGKRIELARKRVEFAKDSKYAEFKFTNVDHELILSFGDQIIQYDLGRGMADAGDSDRAAETGVAIFGRGALELSRIGLFRDIHYISEPVMRAGPGDPFILGTDEYFTCGDNSPASFDCRRWAREGKGNGDTTYRMGVVPRDYLIGKAFFLYWGNAFKPVEQLMPIIPNFAQIKPIYGGRDEF